jgi:hypothetical protein
MSQWQWNDPPEPVELSGLVIRLKPQQGDSATWLARRRKQPYTPEPSPRYLLKRGKDAINERIASWLAERYDLPHQVVRWTRENQYPEVAIRFEGAAYRPEKIDPPAGTATINGTVAPLHNLADYYRHKVAAFLEEEDGEEFMLRDGFLFRIDAAATCEGAHLRWIECVTDVPFQWTNTTGTMLFRDWAKQLHQQEPGGYTPFISMVQTLAQDASLMHDVPQAFQASPFGDQHALVACFQAYIQERQYCLRNANTG